VARYLADTSAWHRSGQVFELWEQLVAADELVLCVPIRLELLYSARGKSDYSALARDLESFPSLTVDSEVERKATRSQAALAAIGQHRGATPVDILVAAVAERHGLTVLHYDRHFDVIARVTGQPTEWIARRGSLD
jgi:predicted nucleic acid-binding protein